MNRSIIPVILYLTLSPIILSAQDYITVTGKVFDSETKMPLSYAHVGVKGIPIGTVTNNDGEFDFPIPTRYSGDTLFISMMGYAGYQERITDLKQKSDLIINLKIKSIPLKEVIVKTDRLTTKEILATAFQKVGENFPDTPYELKGFYRKLNSENDTTVLLIEAAIDIFDSGYQPIKGPKDRVREKVFVRNDRTSLSHFQSVYKGFRGSENSLTKLLMRNGIKYRDPKTERFLLYEKPEMDSVMFVDDRVVFVVSLSFEDPRLTRKTTYYIDSETYAFLKFKKEVVAKEGFYLGYWAFPNDGAYFFKVKRVSDVYEFENYQANMYLKYAYSNAHAHIYNSNNDTVEWEFTSNVVLVINEIKNEYVKVPRGPTVDRSRSLRFQTKEYNPTFWNNFDQVILFPLTTKQLEDLECDMPLEDQFKMAQFYDNPR